MSEPTDGRVIKVGDPAMANVVNVSELIALKQQLAESNSVIAYIQSHGKPPGVYFDRSEYRWVYDDCDETESVDIRAAVLHEIAKKAAAK